MLRIAIEFIEWKYIWKTFSEKAVVAAKWYINKK
jgi:hypothetical protein